jgi:long-chain acyl-CoA synthetase
LFGIERRHFPQLNRKHLQEIIEDTEPAFIISDIKTVKQLENCLNDGLKQKVLVYHNYEDGVLKQDIRSMNTNLDLRIICSDSTLDSLAPPPFGTHENDNHAFLRVYTSGTTKKPKGIDISYRGLIGNERAFCDILNIDKNNRFYNILPMSYLGGIHNLLLLPASVGGSVVIDEPLGGPNLYGFWETVRVQKINTLWFTSTMLAMLLSLRDEGNLGWVPDQIKLGLVGMSPLSVNLKKEFESKFGFTLYENFAMSETTFVSTNIPSIAYRAGSSGVLLPEIEVDILDIEENILPEEQEGQVFVRSPYMMLGYVNAAEEDANNIKSDGIFTGDLGYMSKNELFITGRIKDLIIRGGLNISPAQVESVLVEIEEISEAAVVGIPDPIYGEEVAAAVTLKPWALETTEQYLLNKLKNKISHFQKPKKLIITKELPQGLTGKIDKKAVKALFFQNYAGNP